MHGINIRRGEEELYHRLEEQILQACFAAELLVERASWPGGIDGRVLVSKAFNLHKTLTMFRYGPNLGPHIEQEDNDRDRWEERQARMRKQAMTN